MGFLERDSCVSCGQKDKIISILSIPYKSPSLTAQIKERYVGKIKESDIPEKEYKILMCKNCNFFFQKYVPDDDLSLKIYSYDKSRVEKSLSKKRDAATDYYYKFSLLIRKVCLTLNKNPNQVKILDFGSGWGYFLKMASAFGAPVQGVEISPERVAYCSAQGIPVVNSLKELDQKYEFIYSDQTLEHLNSPSEILQELTKYLSPEGVIYLAVPNCKNVLKKLRSSKDKILEELYPLEHLNGFTNKSLRKMAEKSNLEIVPPETLFLKLLKASNLKRNGDLFQEALKSFYKQKNTTALLFRNKTKN